MPSVFIEHCVDYAIENLDGVELHEAAARSIRATQREYGSVADFQKEHIIRAVLVWLTEIGHK